MKYDGVNPLEKLHPGEPFFFIRAQDIYAPAAVMSYASLLRASGDHPGALAVRNVVDHMLEWQEENREKVKKPD